MIAGHPEYGCMISQEKTWTNFDYDVQIMNVVPPGQKCMPRSNSVRVGTDRNRFQSFLGVVY